MLYFNVLDDMTKCNISAGQTAREIGCAIADCNAYLSVRIYEVVDLYTITKNRVSIQKLPYTCRCTKCI